MFLHTPCIDQDESAISGSVLNFLNRKLFRLAAVLFRLKRGFGVDFGCTIITPGSHRSGLKVKYRRPAKAP